MLCEKIIGNFKDFDVKDRQVQYVNIEWHEVFKKIHKKQSSTGEDVGIRMDDAILTRGLLENDVIYEDEKTIVVVTIPPCEAIEIKIAPNHDFALPKVCYEIGNRHAPLFFGEDKKSFVTPYNEPMITMLEKIHGVIVEKKDLKLDFEHRVSAMVHNHQH